MDIKSNIKAINDTLTAGCKLIAVSKTQPVEKIQEAYQTGQRIFGENKAQEVQAKYEALPKDIEWHMIGHLQSNKVKYIAPFVSLIHSVDSVKLLEEINRQGQKSNRVIPCLLQIYIADEDTKFGFSQEEVIELLNNYPPSLTHVHILGLMGMASFTNDQQQIRAELCLGGQRRVQYPTWSHFLESFQLSLFRWKEKYPWPVSISLMNSVVSLDLLLAKLTCEFRMLFCWNSTM